MNSNYMSISKKVKTSLFFFIATMLSITCSPPFSIHRSVNEDLVSGTWRITEFTEGGMDKTSAFDNYMFDFIVSGRLEASKGLIEDNGEFFMLPLILAEDILANLRLSIDSFENDTLKELHESWSFQSQSEILMSLMAGNKVLIIEKN